ncbi:cobalt ECF transporter T component CbiQ [Syntrophomonas wolfei]|jgi:cobalt/nickel transport system permease protein|uniref:cobalt ECF transporter T component CbiQ n=1 Tax=Syntrophomonas wolfei TaxID=863 RepID=UPI000773FA1A|nr:cobalt ECF transporter T component CbiQ [Syntrophomonas wolfei]
MLNQMDSGNRIKLPLWMEQGNDPGTFAPCSGRKTHRFLGRTINEMKKTLADDLTAEYYAGQDGLLQRFDPRSKLIMAIIVILLAGLTRSITVLLALWLLSLVLMYCSHLPVLSLQKRIWLFIPLLTLLISLPATLNIFNPGDILLKIHSFGEGAQFLGIKLPAVLYISWQGACSAAFLFLRVGISLTFGILLAISTPVARLLRSLQVLGVPQLFIMIVEMSFRYLLLLLNISIEMYEARSLRTVGKLPPKTQRAMVASSIAALFVRSMTLSEEVYQAMASRCYTGEAVSIEEMKMGRLDFAAILIIIVLTFSITFGGAFFG